MFYRNLLLVLGSVFILAGIALAVMWLRERGGAIETPIHDTSETHAAMNPAAVLTAAHSLPSGTLLQSADIVWKEIGPSELHPGNLVRGQISETEFLGAITTRDFSSGEALVASDLVKTGNRRFLAAVLKPGSRAVSISVDAAQSASGLVLPGNHVDVILTQNLSGLSSAFGGKTVAETFLHGVRVIAVDQVLSQQPKTASTETTVFTETRLPKTVTLELSEQEAEMLFVATQLGSLQLSLRPLQSAPSEVGAEDHRAPTWAFDVSPALKEIERRPPEHVPSGSTLEGSVRRAPPTSY